MATLTLQKKDLCILLFGKFPQALDELGISIPFRRIAGVYAQVKCIRSQERGFHQWGQRDILYFPCQVDFTTK